MPEVKDTGKVWIKGESSPRFAIRVDEKIFVPVNAGEDVKSWRIEGEFLCVDLSLNGVCTARRLDLNLPAIAPGTLFSGFEDTKHGDVLVAVFCGL